MQDNSYAVRSVARQELLFSDTVLLLDYVFCEAVRAGASDAHLQYQEYDAVVRLRVDGVLAPVLHITHEQARALLCRLKILMHLDSTQTHEPQDGALRLRVQEKTIDVRGSFFPAQQGEKAVIRFLDGAAAMVQVHTLPFAPAILARLYEMARCEQGLFLVTGPTGSGKTTTLYALLQAVDRLARNVVTLENPVEYRIEHVTQTDMKATASFTFAQAVRSLLRQDPDVALIGELRDSDTVHSAVEAALTGHLVFSSLHTSSASGVPIRLREMGVEPYLIAHALKGVLGQRLFLMLCGFCKRMAPLSAYESRWVAAHGGTIATTGVPVGCKACRYTGFKGQTIVAELWWCSGAAVAALLQSDEATQADFEKQACLDGMTPLIPAALPLVAAGLVPLSDLMSKEV